MRKLGWLTALLPQWRTRRTRAIIGGLGLALALALLWLLLRTWGPLRPRDEIWSRIQREGMLRVGMDASYPPFENVDERGQFSGLDVDLSQALAQRWGVQVRWVNVHFDGLYDALRSDKFDLIISALPYDRTMTRDLAYSQSYFNAGQVILARGEAPSLRSFEDLAGRRVAVELGAESHQLARKLARDKGLAVEVVPARELAAALEMLRHGEVSAVICDRIAAATAMQQDPELQVVGEPLTQQPYVIAALPTAPLLMQEVNVALQEWQASGFLEELQSKWFR
jgi:polar amino acid transport system substrate-binding protein